MSSVRSAFGENRVINRCANCAFRTRFHPQPHRQVSIHAQCVTFDHWACIFKTTLPWSFFIVWRNCGPCLGLLPERPTMWSVWKCVREVHAAGLLWPLSSPNAQKTDTSLGRHFQNQWHIKFLCVKYFLDILCIQTEGDGSILPPSTYRDYMERPCHSRILSPTFSFVFHVPLTSEMYG